MSQVAYNMFIVEGSANDDIYSETIEIVSPIAAPSSSEPLTRVTGLVHYWSAGPNAVSQLEILTGGLFSQYFSPVSSVKTPEPTIPREVPLYQPTLLDYAHWLGARTHEQQVAIFGETAISLSDWRRWAMNELSKGRSIR
jgi:hypothetical protein